MEWIGGGCSCAAKGRMCTHGGEQGHRMKATGPSLAKQNTAKGEKKKKGGNRGFQPQSNAAPPAKSVMKA